MILGDVNAVGNLRVTSQLITLLARSAGTIRTNTGGSINDPMVDYVVGGQVFFSTAPVMGGSGTQATFSNPTGNVDGSGTLGNFAKTVYLTPITAALLTGQAINPDSTQASQLLILTHCKCGVGEGDVAARNYRGNRCWRDQKRVGVQVHIHRTHC